MIKSPRAILIVLTALNLLNYLDRYLVVGVGTGIQAELLGSDGRVGISDGQFGDITTAFMWGYFITSPFFGWLGDRYPRRWLIAAGVGGWSFATALSGLAPSYGWMLAARALVGIGEASYATLSPTIIDDLAAPTVKNRWLAIFYVAIPVGSALGFLVGGQLLGALGWRGTFFMVGGPGILLSLLVLLVHEPARLDDAPRGDERPRAVYGELLRVPRYVYAVLGYTAQTFALGGFASFAVLFLIRKYDFPAAKATLAFGAITVLTGLGGTAFGGWLADLIPGADRSRVALGVCAWSSVAAAPLALAALLVPSAAGFLVALAACQIAIFASVSPTNTALLLSVPAGLRANAMALSIFATHLLGDILSPPLIGRISDAHHNGATGLQSGMYLLPAALALSAAAWARGASIAPVTLPDTA